MILFRFNILQMCLLDTPQMRSCAKTPQSYKIARTKAIGVRIMRQIKFIITRKHLPRTFKTKQSDKELHSNHNPLSPQLPGENLRFSQSLLMLRTQQILNNLHRRECRDWHIHEDCTPISHRTIPQARKFLRTQLTTATRLR